MEERSPWLNNVPIECRGAQATGVSARSRSLSCFRWERRSWWSIGLRPSTPHDSSVTRRRSASRGVIFQSRGVLYRPWDWMVWWSRWYSEPTLAPLWELCAREAVFPMIALTAIAMGAIAVARHGWFRNPSDLHGSARWANTRNLRAAGLIDKSRLLPRRLRRIAERAKVLKPFSHRAGVYLGVWRRWGKFHYLRDCGPSHILVFAPTRSGKGVGIVIPTLLTWPHSALIHDLKGENWALTQVRGSGWAKSV